jgi:Helicase conserved C-terminal domain
VCCALPKLDLVIVDEAHNLKHGFSPSGSARNLVLAEAFGRHSDDDLPNPRFFPTYGPRASRVLFLSATPIEETYRHLWNQLDLFGLASKFDELRDEKLPEATRKQVAAKFLVRRVTSIRLAGREHTKNMYRRQWRAGGVLRHDEPIAVTDVRQRLIVALVQKKVSELLSGKQFKRSFQIGMLASFESFLETSNLKRDGDEVFDDAEQTDSALEREGIDVHDLNRLATSYRKKFGREMPHPKMDALVDSLASSWTTGGKSLVFVRRVASVKELKRKLDERYDDWLIASLLERLPEKLREPFGATVERYRHEKQTALSRPTEGTSNNESNEPEAPMANHGGHDTFFAWFFRGDGPKGVLSGANLQSRFIQGSGAYATFFADNHVAALLDVEPGQVVAALSATLGLSVPDITRKVSERAARYLSARAKDVTRAKRMEASQAAALELLRDGAASDLAERAGVIWRERYESSTALKPARTAPPEIATALERSTFFTELRRPERGALRSRIWPAPRTEDATLEDFLRNFREQELRSELLATAARLGHAFIDLYTCALQGRATLSLGRGARASDAVDDEATMGEVGDERLCREYLDLLETQRIAAGVRPWGAFEELAEIAENFEMILDVNLADARTDALDESAHDIASLLRQQQPTGGMAGQINQTLVRQFRMPGYPFVLITTDLLQEGEDLHTFCSSVHHYGISWTPSAMEQRIGRIDRVRSQTERRLTELRGEVAGEDWLQVYFPYLQDTVEVLQVERVLERTNTFLRLMHEGLTVPANDQRRIDVQREMVAARSRVAVIREPLTTAFPIPEWATKGSKMSLAVDSTFGAGLRERFEQLPSRCPESLAVEWVKHPPKGSLLGTATLPNGRIQPFSLVLRSEQGIPVVRCVSPIGRTMPDEETQPIVERAARVPSRIGAILTKEERSYDLTVEDDVLLVAHKHDAARIAILIRRVTEQADRMEREHFEDGRDQRLDAFEADLREEAYDGS